MDSILGKKLIQLQYHHYYVIFIKLHIEFNILKVLSFYIVHSHLVVIFMLHLLHVLYHLAFRHLF